MRSRMHRTLLFTVDLTVQGGTELTAIGFSEKLTMCILKGCYSTYKIKLQSIYHKFSLKEIKPNECLVEMVGKTFFAAIHFKHNFFT